MPDEDPPKQNKGASSSLSKALADMADRVKPNRLVGGKTFKRALQHIIAGLPVGGRNVRISESPHGRMIEAYDAGAAESNHPWKGTVSEGEVHILGGVLGTVSVDTADFSVDTDGTVVVYLVANCTLNVVNDFVASWTLDTVVFADGPALPDDNPLGGVYHIMLLTIQDGELEIQHKTTDLGFRVIDDGTQSGAGNGETWLT